MQCAALELNGQIILSGILFTWTEWRGSHLYNSMQDIINEIFAKKKRDTQSYEGLILFMIVQEIKQMSHGFCILVFPPNKKKC